MRDVLFVVPVFQEDIAQECNGTLILATILKEKGIDVEIYRYYESNPEEGFEAFVENSARNILARNPSIVSFYCRGDCYISNIRVAEKIKNTSPNTTIVFGGPQADLSASETIKNIPWVDYCCSGEGEKTIYPLFSGILKGEDVSSVSGLTYRNADGEVVSNPRPELLQNLDELPFIDYTLLPEKIKHQAKEAKKPVNIDVGRGCPYKCAYCSTSKFWQRKFRIKSPERIMKDVLWIEKNFGINKCVFDHDLFTVDKSKVYEFCRLIKENSVNVRWGCSSRADTIDKDLIDAMVDAGLRSMYLGIETGSERMQKLTHKNLNLDKASEIIEYLLKKDVKTTASFIYGFPEETEEDVEQTLQFIYSLYKKNILSVQLHLCAIFPGTEYYDTYKEQLHFTENSSDQVGDFGLKENEEFIKEHNELFPFYYEYRSELRDKFVNLSRYILFVLEIYRNLNIYDPQKFAETRLVDLYLDFVKINDSLLGEMGENPDKIALINNYLSSVYPAETAEKFKEILRLNGDLISAKHKGDACEEIKVYNIDVNAVMEKKSLDEIAVRPVVLYIKCDNGQVTYKPRFL